MEKKSIGHYFFNMSCLKEFCGQEQCVFHPLATLPADQLKIPESDMFIIRNDVILGLYQSQH